jgi:2-desacetyl-2-hydroxyethyl bacteriochlorophyllide A dehydrogenase
MQAIWLEDRSLSIREDLPIPKPRNGETLIRVRLAGICNTDLEMVRGYYPFTGIIGHEFVGEVVESADSSLVGQRVSGEINIVCGECLACRKGDSGHCVYRSTLGIRERPGCFAEFVTLPTQNLHRISKNLSDEIGVFVEPLAAALEIQRQVHVHLSDRVLVIGAGRLGQLIAQTLALTGCDLYVVVRHPHQREILEERGIHTISDDQIHMRKFDLVVDAAGTADGFSLARKAVRPRGIIVLKSTYAENLTFDISSLVVDEITVIGSRCGPFEPALRLLETGLVDPTPLITARYRLAEGLTAIDHAGQSGALKILLEM